MASSNATIYIPPKREPRKQDQLEKSKPMTLQAPELKNLVLPSEDSKRYEDPVEFFENAAPGDYLVSQKPASRNIDIFVLQKHPELSPECLSLTDGKRQAPLLEVSTSYKKGVGYCVRRLEDGVSISHRPGDPFVWFSHVIDPMQIIGSLLYTVSAKRFSQKMLSTVASKAALVELDVKL